MADAAALAGRGAACAATLVVLEIALSLVLLVGASLFVRSFLNLQDAHAGIDTAPLMTLRFYMPGDQYEPPDAMIRRVDDIVRRVEALPGVVVGDGVEHGAAGQRRIGWRGRSRRRGVRRGPGAQRLGTSA